jgi:phospholipase C
MNRLFTAAAVAVAAIACAALASSASAAHRRHRSARPAASSTSTTTPIKHVVVLFQENVSFDHYFATYPNAANTGGEPSFDPAPGTPSVNGLNESLSDPNNPNSTQPFRLDRSQFQTCDQDHKYKDEQDAFDNGQMDKFVETVGVGGSSCADYGKGAGLVMGYYDGNTVTAMWNYAQRFAMSDNSYNTTFGPSTPGALNLVSGQTHGFTAEGSAVTPNNTVIGDPQPAGDKCDTRDTSSQVTSGSGAGDKNVGDLLNARGVTWGWFQGGFDNCTETHTSKGGQTSKDYIPHHEPFQYYPSTSNLQHLPPSSTGMIGRTDQANHQYDLTRFWDAVDDGNLPAVSFLKAPAYEDGHAGYSNPLDEQEFVVNTINRLERSGEWGSTAVIIAYDDSDGWYDHQMSPIVNQSGDASFDGNVAGGACGSSTHAMGGYLDRCGYGPRLPLLAISPFAKSNFVDHSTTDQSSILSFIEDNWSLGRIGDFSFDAMAGSLSNLFDFTNGRRAGGAGRLFLDPGTGEPQH